MMEVRLFQNLKKDWASWAQISEAPVSSCNPWCLEQMNFSRGLSVTQTTQRWLWSIAIMGILATFPHLVNPLLPMARFSYKLYKQSGNIQPWWTPFSILNQSIVPCQVRTEDSSNKFIKRVGDAGAIKNLASLRTKAPSGHRPRDRGFTQPALSGKLLPTRLRVESSPTWKLYTESQGWGVWPFNMSARCLWASQQLENHPLNSPRDSDIIPTGTRPH